jgi:hypothetical protein
MMGPLPPSGSTIGFQMVPSIFLTLPSSPTLPGQMSWCGVFFRMSLICAWKHLGPGSWFR